MRITSAKAGPLGRAFSLNRNIQPAIDKRVAVDEIASSAVDLHRAENPAAAADEPVAPDDDAADHIIQANRGLPRMGDFSPSDILPDVVGDLDAGERRIGVDVERPLIVAFKHAPPDAVRDDAHVVRVGADRA